MDMNAVIAQLRQYCPELGGRVGGAADFDTGTETVLQITDPITGKLAYPAAVVIPLEDDATGLNIQDGNQQVVTETIAVIVEFDSAADRRGQGGVSQVEAMKYAIFRAILNWNPDPNPATTRSAQGLFYDGGSLLTFDRARLFWQYRFNYLAEISDADGFAPRGLPLTRLVGTIEPQGGTDLSGNPVVAPPFNFEITPS